MKGLTWGSCFLMVVIVAVVTLAAALKDPLWWVDEGLQNYEFVGETQNSDISSSITDSMVYDNTNVSPDYVEPTYDASTDNFPCVDIEEVFSALEGLKDEEKISQETIDVINRAQENGICW